MEEVGGVGLKQRGGNSGGVEVDVITLQPEMRRSNHLEFINLKMLQRNLSRKFSFSMTFSRH